jgi:copper(I)-binding protein
MQQFRPWHRAASGEAEARDRHLQEERTMIFIRTLASAAVAIGAIVVAHAVRAADITVDDIWARESTAATGAAFMTVHNAGPADRIVKAASPVAGVVELHTHIKEGDIMRMRPVEAIDVPANGMVALQPGGLHVMLIDLKQPLVAGQTLPLTMVFEKAGSMQLTVPVHSMKPMGGDAGGAPMQHKHQ